MQMKWTNTYIYWLALVHAWTYISFIIKEYEVFGGSMATRKVILGLVLGGVSHVHIHTHIYIPAQE